MFVAKYYAGALCVGCLAFVLGPDGRTALGGVSPTPGEHVTRTVLLRGDHSVELEGDVRPDGFPPEFE